MPRYNNQEIIYSIQNGDRDIMFYLCKKYFQSARRILRRRGFRDSQTPETFSFILVKVIREVQQMNLSGNIDFEKFLFNNIREFISEEKNFMTNNRDASDEKVIASDCFCILDSDSKKILSARYVEKLSFEQIAARLNFSNPLIAEFEFNKASDIFENITKARLSVKNN